MGRINSAFHDTTPGCVSVLSPPSGWTGDPSEYLALIRHRYTVGVEDGQQIIVASKLLKRGEVDVVINGPWAKEAYSVLLKAG